MHWLFYSKQQEKSLGRKKKNLPFNKFILLETFLLFLAVVYILPFNLGCILLIFPQTTLSSAYQLSVILSFLFLKFPLFLFSTFSAAYVLNFSRSLCIYIQIFCFDIFLIHPITHSFSQPFRSSRRH